jgi:predicted DNA-binding protein YlxM (UPF0122 family)
MFEKNLNYSYLLDFYGGLLSEKQRTILSLYFDEDLSLAEIAEEYKLTRQGILHIINKGKKILSDAEEKLGLAESSERRENIYKSAIEDIVAAREMCTEDAKKLLDQAIRKLSES